MEITNNPDIDFPAANITISQPGAAPSEMVNQVTQKVEAAVRGVDGVDEINSERPRRQQQHLCPVQDRHADRSRGERRQGRDRPDPRRSSRRHPRTAGQPPGHQRRRLRVHRRAGDRHEPRGSELVRRQHRVAPPARAGRGRAGQPRRRRRPPDPRRSSILPRCRRRASPPRRSTSSCARSTSTRRAAGPKSPAPNRPSACSAMRAAPTALAETQISLPGGRFVRLGDIAQVRDSSAEPRSADRCSAAGRWSASTSPRAKGASDVTAYDNTWAELQQDRGSTIRGSTSSRSTTASTTPRANIRARCTR